MVGRPRAACRSTGGECVESAFETNTGTGRAPAGTAPLPGEDRKRTLGRPVLLFASALPRAPAHSLPPCPTASPQPGSDMAFVFMPRRSLSGIKASVSGNTDSPGDPRGQGSRLFSESIATLLCHLPRAWAPHRGEIAGANRGGFCLLGSPPSGRRGNRAENVPPGEAVRRPGGGP